MKVYAVWKIQWDSCFDDYSDEDILVLKMHKNDAIEYMKNFDAVKEYSDEYSTWKLIADEMANEKYREICIAEYRNIYADDGSTIIGHQSLSNELHIRLEIVDLELEES